MAFKIYVANLASKTSTKELKKLFDQAGGVKSASIISAEELKNAAEEPDLGHVLPFVSKYEHAGLFACVEMLSLPHAKAAVECFENIELPKGGFLVAMSGPHGGDEKP
jgi:hypothetical protein